MSDQKFEKKPTMGITLENGYFGNDGNTGLNISAYGGFIQISFWRKGEKPQQNVNKLMLNINQAIFLSKTLGAIVNQRFAEFKNGGAESYSEIANQTFSINGFLNGQTVVFGTVKLDTVLVDGIKRVRINFSRESYDISVVFCDRFMSNIIPTDSDLKPAYDIMDSSLFRLFQDISGYVNFSWQQGAFNKLFSVITGGNSNSGGGNRQYQNNNTRYEKPSNSSGGKSSGGGDDIFEDDVEF